MPNVDRPPKPPLSPGWIAVAETAPNWRTPSRFTRCRRKTGTHTMCEQAPVADLERHRLLDTWQGERVVPSWWGYCPAHMLDYGRWVEDGRVMCWAVREVTPAGGAA